MIFEYIWVCLCEPICTFLREPSLDIGFAITLVNNKGKAPNNSFPGRQQGKEKSLVKLIYFSLYHFPDPISTFGKVKCYIWLPA